jgi:hypothetical protein
MAEGFGRYLAESADNGVPEGEDATAQEGTKNRRNDAKFHEAGYDAFITGRAFLRFAGFILKERERISAEEEEDRAIKKRKLDDEADDNAFANALSAIQAESGVISHDQDATETNSTVKEQEQEQEKGKEENDEEEDGEVQETPMEKLATLEKRKRVITYNPTDDILESEELKCYYNQLHMMKSEIPFMNLIGPEPEPEEKPYHYMLRDIPEGFQQSMLFQLFDSFNPYRFIKVDATSAWIQLSTYRRPVEGEEPSREPYEPTPPPLGRLGEEFVNPHYVGDSDTAVRGRKAGVVPEAANIEVLSWRSYYDERKKLERQNRELVRQQRQQELQQHHNGRYQKRPIRGLDSRQTGTCKLLIEWNNVVPGSQSSRWRSTTKAKTPCATWIAPLVR